MKTKLTTTSIVFLATLLASYSAMAGSYFVVSGGGFVNESHSAPRSNVNDPPDSQHFFGRNPTYGHANKSAFQDFNRESLNNNPVYMDFSWGAGFFKSPPDDMACISNFRSCLRILDNDKQTDENDLLLGPDTTPPKEQVYEKSEPASQDNNLGYSLAEEMVPVDDPGPGDPNPLGWFTHYNKKGDDGTGTVDVHWALRVYRDEDGFEADANDSTPELLDSAIAGVEAFFRLGIQDTPNIGADVDDIFWLEAISFDGEEWAEIANGIVDDISWFEFEDGENLMSVNLYALSRNPRCPRCTGEILSPEEGEATGWVNMRLENLTVPVPPNLTLFGVGSLILAMCWRHRRHWNPAGTVVQPA